MQHHVFEIWSCVGIMSPFFLLLSIPLDEYSCLFAHLPTDDLFCKVISWAPVISLGKYLGGRLLEYMASIYLTFKKLPNCFHSYYTIFTFPPAICGSSNFFTCLSTLGIVSLFQFRPSYCVWSTILIVILIYICFMTNGWLNRAGICKLCAWTEPAPTFADLSIE